jgi:hypothetical protein
MQTTFNIQHLEKNMETEILELTPTKTLFADKKATISTEEPVKKSKFLCI